MSGARQRSAEAGGVPSGDDKAKPAPAPAPIIAPRFTASRHASIAQLLNEPYKPKSEVAEVTPAFVEELAEHRKTLAQKKQGQDKKDDAAVAVRSRSSRRNLNLYVCSRTRLATGPCWFSLFSWIRCRDPNYDKTRCCASKYCCKKPKRVSSARKRLNEFLGDLIKSCAALSTPDRFKTELGLASCRLYH